MMWFDNRDIRPARSGRYLVYKRSREFEVLNYSILKHGWNLYDDDADRDLEIDVECWTFIDTTSEIMKNLVSRNGN